MSFFKKTDENLNKFYNNEFIGQDLRTAKEISEIYFNTNINKSSDNPYKFYLEGIFLGVTDRTAIHPYLVKTKAPEKVGFFDKLKGFQGHTIDYNEDPNFDLKNYLNADWLDPILDSYNKEKDELLKSKDLYVSNKINFFDYFIKRLNVYDAVKHSEHIRHYEGIDREKYIEVLRKEFRLILR